MVGNPQAPLRDPEQAAVALALSTDEQRRAYFIGYEVAHDVDLGGGRVTVPQNDALTGFEFQFKLGVEDRLAGRAARVTWTKLQPAAKSRSTWAGVLIAVGVAAGVAGVAALGASKRTRPNTSLWS